MSRINPVDRNTTTDGVRRNFDAIQKRLGMVPNMMQTMAQSSHVLEGYLGLSGALGLAVSEVNACDYCLSAHSALGRGAGLSNDELDASRTGRSAAPKTTAALQFARAVVERRGGISDNDLDRVRAAGFSDAEVVEIIAHVALNVFTNYFNRAAETEIDFPRVTAGQLV